MKHVSAEETKIRFERYSLNLKFVLINLLHILVPRLVDEPTFPPSDKLLRTSTKKQANKQPCVF